MAIDIDEAKVERNEFGLWLAWALATALGMILGYLPAALVVSDIDLGIARILVPLLAGLLIGVAQWTVLRGYVTRSHDWILNHAGGWVVGYILGLLVVQGVGRTALGALIGYLIFGILVAVFQWPILRREIPHVIPWILANVIGWTAGSYVSTLVVGAISRNTPPSLIASTLITSGLTGLIGGAVTGLALVWIVKKPERFPG